MTATNPKRVPKVRHHKASNQGYVQLEGRFVYLGRYDAPETAEAYHRLIAEWLAGKQLAVAPGENLTVVELLAAYMDHAREYYTRADGRATVEISHLKSAARIVRDLYARTPATDFGPLALKACRERMVEKGWCRRHVNQQTTRIKRVVRWAVENELIGGEAYHALQAVAGLRRGHTKAAESHAVNPAPLEFVQAVKPYVSRQVWALIQLQILTAARGGELVLLRPRDVDRSGATWLYTPADHKTAHHGHARTIYIGPRAQSITPSCHRVGQRLCHAPDAASVVPGGQLRRRESVSQRLPETHAKAPGSFEV